MIVIDEIQEMQIEDVIKLPNFHLLRRNDGLIDDPPFLRMVQPHWEITLIGEPLGGGMFILCGIKSPHKYFTIYKPINDGKI